MFITKSEVAGRRARSCRTPLAVPRGLAVCLCAGFGLRCLLFLARLVLACAATACAPRSGASGGPGGGKDGVRGKPRGNPGAVGKSSPVVSPARAEGSLGLTVERRSRSDLALGSPWGGGEVGNGGAARPARAVPCSQAQPVITRAAHWPHVRYGSCVGAVRMLLRVSGCTWRSED
jgi:hypothetical protein